MHSCPALSTHTAILLLMLRMACIPASPQFPPVHMNGLIPTYAQNEKLSEATTPRTCAAQTVYASKSNIPASYATVSRCSVQAQTGNLSNDYEYRTTSLKHGAHPTNGLYRSASGFKTAAKCTKCLDEGPEASSASRVNFRGDPAPKWRQYCFEG